MVRRIVMAIVAAVALTVGACNRQPPTTPTPAPSKPEPMSMRIIGTTTFTGPGETQQLTVLGMYGDGERPVTDGARWSTSDAEVAAVNSTGTLATLALGLTSVEASYELSSGRRLVARTPVVVTPLGTFAVAGRTREPGAGNLTGVLVEELGTAQQATSRSGGAFTLGGLTTGRLRLTKAGYESIERAGTAGESIDVPMQKVLKLTPGAEVQSMLAPNDLSYEMAPGRPCSTCRLVRLISDTAGQVTLRLFWSDSRIMLSLWIDGRQYVRLDGNAPIEVNLAVRPGEQLLYVAGTLNYSHVEWSLTASAIGSATSAQSTTSVR